MSRDGALLSLVTVFFSLAPLCMSLSSAPLLFVFGGGREETGALGGGGGPGGGGGGGGIAPL